MLITNGRMLVQSFHDIADAVDVAAAEKLLAERLPRLRPMRQARHLHVPQPPLEVSLDPRPCPLRDLRPASLVVHIFDVGAVAATWEVDLPSPLAAEDLMSLAARVLAQEDDVTAAGRSVAEEILKGVRPACKSPGLSPITEAYTTFVIEATEPALDADAFAQAIDIPVCSWGSPSPSPLRSERR